ncbi:MAG: CDP-alcohol phosphatidyltransferase family protein, partial [Methanobacteriota archaeon]
MLSSRFRGIADPYTSILARPFAKAGLSPNVLTVIGLLFSVIAGVMYALHNLIFASLALLFTSFFDVLDGAVARL